MSHHLDSPLARQDPRLNITDQYLFDADGATAMVLNVRTSLAGDSHPDPFHPRARYEFKVHLDGGGYEELTYRFAFDPMVEGHQPYTVTRLTGQAARDDATPGEVVASGRTGEEASLAGGGRVWAGQVIEPFYLDLAQLVAVDKAVQHGQTTDLTGFTAGVAADTFEGSSVSSIVLSVPTADDELHSGRRIATWASARLATDGGGWHPVGRTGLPMIWPIFRDADGDEASRPNETHPAQDHELYGAAIGDLIAGVVGRRGTAEDPKAYAAGVLARLVPDVLGYTVGSAAGFGFAGFNGRRLADNAPEVMFSLVTNSAVTTGLTGASPQRWQTSFPYVVPVAN